MRSNNKMHSSIRPYLARRHSKGDYEKPGGSFSRYDAYDMDVQFLQRILKADPSLPAYLPKARLCVYSNMLHWYVATSERSCPKPKRGYNTFMDMKAGVLIITGHPRLIVPSGMKREIQKCRALERRCRPNVSSSIVYYPSRSGIKGHFTPSHDGGPLGCDIRRARRHGWGWVMDGHRWHPFTTTRFIK